MDAALIAFVLMAFCASLVSAVFGFGTALLVLAIGSHILPLQDAIALATVLFAASTIIKTLLYGKQVDWRVAGTMAIASLPFAYAGALMMVELPTELLRRLLALMILTYLVLTRLKLFPSWKIGNAGLVVGSSLYGFISGLLGSGNLIKAIIFREMKLSKQAFVGAMAATSVLSNIGKLTAYTGAGLLSKDQAVPIVALCFAALLAALLGKKILGVMPHPQFETGIQLILAVSAIGLLI